MKWLEELVLCGTVWGKPVLLPTTPFLQVTRGTLCSLRTRAMAGLLLTCAIAWELDTHRLRAVEVFPLHDLQRGYPGCPDQ
jgi:hypothetical protein